MEKILVSACLLGEKTRYDGKDNFFSFIEELRKVYDIIPYCPEVEAGLGIPREKAEIVKGKVLSESGKNLTVLYREAALKAVQLCEFFGIRIAILKDGSPACGSRMIHDGSFTSNKIEGLGVTARALIEKGIKVYCERDNLEFLLGESEERKNARLRRNLRKADEKERISKIIRSKDLGRNTPAAPNENLV